MLLDFQQALQQCMYQSKTCVEWKKFRCLLGLEQQQLRPPRKEQTRCKKKHHGNLAAAAAGGSLFSPVNCCKDNAVLAVEEQHFLNLGNISNSGTRYQVPGTVIPLVKLPKEKKPIFNLCLIKLPFGMILSCKKGKGLRSACPICQKTSHRAPDAAFPLFPLHNIPCISFRVSPPQIHRRTTDIRPSHHPAAAAAALGQRPCILN